jgi:hypothetical protein
LPLSTQDELIDQLRDQLQSLHPRKQP